METEDIPPTTLNPVPVTAAWEIVTVDVPVLLRVRVCGLVDPAATFPKLNAVALAISVPGDGEAEFVFAGIVPAPVNPVHPATQSTAKQARIRANMPHGALRLVTRRPK
jgi:hypothetical protein